MKIGAVLPQGWVGEYDGWDPLDAWRRTTEVARQVPLIQKATGLPVGVGFGIKDGPTAARVAGFADAVVVGSRLIEVIEQGPEEGAAARAGDFVRSLRQAMDAVSGGGAEPRS